MSKSVIGIAATHPELAKQWHPTKNLPLQPSDVSYGSSRKVWWICEKGHEWEVSPNCRSRGRGCPVCSNKKVLTGYNDLATFEPEIAAEWHPTKNGDLLPSEVMRASNKKVWWQCRKGHEWKAAISHRVLEHTGCPLCFGELQTSFPEQAILYYLKQVTSAESRNTEFGKEMDVWLPDLRVGIEYNGWWHRNKAEADKRKVSFFAARDIRIITIKESEQNLVNGDVIEYIYSTNKDSLNWAISSIFHLLHLPSPPIDSKKDAPDIYAQYIQLAKESSLAILLPAVAAEWHPTKNGSITPEDVALKSNKSFWWQCTKGHEWQATVSDRSNGKSCPICSNKKLLSGYNDLATIHPEIAIEWHPSKNGDLTPQDVIRSSAKKVWWQCSVCNHEWQATINNRSNGKSCPKCGRVNAGRSKVQTLISRSGSLQLNNPALASEWHPTRNGDLTPSDVTHSSNKKVWWICAVGHEWEAQINARNKGSGCPFCWELRRSTAKGKNAPKK